MRRSLRWQRPVTCRPGRAALLLVLALSGVGAAYPAAARGKVHTVAMEAVAFSPHALQVDVGDTVIWTNKDPFPHTVKATGGEFASAQVLPGQTWKRVVQKPGSFPYFCTLHETMKGTLVVK